LNADLKTRSRPENKKPGNEKLNSRFTLTSPFGSHVLNGCIIDTNLDLGKKD
jgi:hypothetical protein